MFGAVGDGRVKVSINKLININERKHYTKNNLLQVSEKKPTDIQEKHLNTVDFKIYLEDFAFMEPALMLPMFFHSVDNMYKCGTKYFRKCDELKELQACFKMKRYTNNPVKYDLSNVENELFVLSRYRTKPCKHYRMGFCKFGDNCNFIH